MVTDDAFYDPDAFDEWDDPATTATKLLRYKRVLTIAFHDFTGEHVGERFAEPTLAIYFEAGVSITQALADLCRKDGKPMSLMDAMLAHDRADAKVRSTES